MEVNTGEPKWKTDIGPIRRDGAGDGPRCTPTIDGDKVYALGAQGALVCLELKTGRGIWQKNILREYDASNIGWGISESVLIDGEKLICTPGGRNATVVALNKRTGETIWKSAVPGNPAAAYASPIVVEAAGVRQYVNFTHSAIVGVRASDGEFLWQDNGSANGTANCSTALAFDNYVFSASGYGTGGALVELSPSGDGVTARRVYKTNDMKNHHGGMVHLDGYIYGSNDPGLLVCMEAKTGKVVWQDRSVGKGSLTYADGHLYLRSENGPMALVEATPQGYREKGRFDQPQRSNHSSWAHPVVAQGKLFLRDMDVLLAYDVRK
jgi:outer membrane protein assembly factor BamB